MIKREGEEEEETSAQLCPWLSMNPNQVDVGRWRALLKSMSSNPILYFPSKVSEDARAQLEALTMFYVRKLADIDLV